MFKMKPGAIRFTIAISICFLTLANPVCSQGQRGESEITPFLSGGFDNHSQNWAIAQSPTTHLLYMASSSGLVKFDGIKWTTYPSMRGMPLRSVAVDANGTIYTGSFEDFGMWEPGPSGRLRYTSLVGRTSIEKNDEIWKIFIGEQRIVFQSFTSIYIFANNAVEKYKAPYTMLFLHEVGGKLLAQLMENGLYWFENGQFQRVANSEIFANKKVHSIVEHSENKWLVCTARNGLFLFDGVNFSPFESDVSEFLKRNICNAAKHLNDSTLAFGSILNGAVLANQKGEILINYNTSNGLNNNTVLSLYADNRNGLWMGLDEGIGYFDAASPYTHYKCSEAPIGTIYTLLKKGSSLYIGTNHGLFETRIERKGRFYLFKNLKFIDGSQGQVWSLKDFDGQILCGHNDGTFALSNGTIEPISDITGGWAFATYGDYVLQGTYTGIVVLAKSATGQWRFHSKLPDFLEPLRFIEVDYLGYVWASHHQRGAYRLELSDDCRQVTRSEYFPSINGERNVRVFKINNRVIFATTQNIYTYDYVRNQIVNVENLTQGLGEFSKAVHICSFGKNQYWFVKNDKIALFEIELDFTATKLCEIELKNHGLPQRSIELVSLDSTNLLIPTSESFDTYNLSFLKKEEICSHLGICRITFFGAKGDTIEHTNLSGSVWSNWKRNNVTVHFKAPYLFDQPSKLYSYRLKGLDSTWQTTSNNQFTYLNLKHGRYEAEVAGPGNCKSKIIIHIGTPWYQTRYALVAYALLAMLLAILLRQYIRFQINRGKEILAMKDRKNMLEKELDYKNYELMLTIRYLIQKNEILTELKNEVESIKEHSSKYPVKNIRSMETIINEGLKTQTEDWMNALNNLKLSEQGFNKKLLKQFPHLTPNDLRLCSYLRLNFTTKEIARLLNIVPRTVEISRYRLRKKLNLEHDDNLTEFLINEAFSDQP